MRPSWLLTLTSYTPVLPDSACSTASAVSTSPRRPGARYSIVQPAPTVLWLCELQAKAKALSLVPGYVPPSPRSVTLTGERGKRMLMAGVAALEADGKVTPHDVVVTGHLASVVPGGDTEGSEPLDEHALLTLERRHFMQLARTPGTLARIEHMLVTGKPLRN